eukprot:UN07035
MFVFLSLLAIVRAQDPANGWLGYALGVNPNGGSDVITFIEAYWTNLKVPASKSCFYSPWFGIETSDNLNLIQPVNPWTGNQWEIYNEYFQWKPTHNENSRSHRVYPGDLIYGSVTFDAANQAYKMYHADLTTGHEWSVNTTIGVQKEGTNYKKYTMTYFVFEKVCSRCNDYPPDDIVTFTNTTVQWAGKTLQPKWTTAYVDNVCNNRAHVVDEQTITITWNSNSQDHPGDKFARPGHLTPP